MKRSVLFLLGIIACAFLFAQGEESNQTTLTDLVSAYLKAEDEETRKQAVEALKKATSDVFELEKAFVNGIMYDKNVKCGWSALDAEAKDGKKRHFALFVPDKYDPKNPCALLLDLHGGVSRPTLIPPDTLQEYGKQVWEDMPNNNNLIVALPSGQAGATWWDPVGTSNVYETIRQIKRRYAVDDNKIFVTGFSDGGSGSFHFALHCPTPFAGFIPLNGSTLVAQYGGAVFPKNLANKRPLYVVNTTDDPLYPSEREKKVIDLLKNAGGNIEFTVYEKIGHRLDYIDKERPKIRDFIKKTERDPLPKNIIWMTDNPKESGRFSWVIVEEMGETGGEQPKLENLKFTQRLVLGVVIDQQYAGGDGAKVQEIQEGSTADKMGMQKGDLIVKIDNDEIKSFTDLRDALRKKKFEDEITVIVKRDDKEVTLKGKFPPKQEVDAFDYTKPFCSIEVKVTENRIDVKTYRVKRFRLLISSKMFPKDTKVEVYTNGALSFSSVVVPEIDTLLSYAASDMDRSMLFYGSIVVNLEEKKGEEKDEGKK